MTSARVKGWLVSKGIPIDAAGQIKNITEWPWTFRYPIGLLAAVIGIALFFALYTGDKDMRVLAWIVLAGTVICFFACTIELLVVGLFCGLIWGIAALVGLFIPSSWGADRSNWVLTTALIWLGLYASSLSRRLTKMEGEYAAMQKQIMEMHEAQNRELMRRIENILD